MARSVEGASRRRRLSVGRFSSVKGGKPEGVGEALRYQPEDHRQVEEATRCRLSTDTDRLEKADTTVPWIGEDAIIGFGWYTPLSLDDCLYALQATIPHLNARPASLAAGGTSGTSGRSAEPRPLWSP